MTDFATVDGGDARDLVAMMDATDAWRAVHTARAWVLDAVAPEPDALVVDAGCGPGTFGTLVQDTGARTVDVDASSVMLGETRRRRRDARAVLADVFHLPMRNGAAHLVHAERILQWTSDPDDAISELFRITAPGGWIALTDTDWGTFSLDHPDPAAARRLAVAALTWVPHSRVARELRSMIARRGVEAIRTHHDTETITAWDPDDPTQRDGPPGLPLHSIAGADGTELPPVAARARDGEFRAEVTLVTVLARTRRGESP
jgi:ubiquinone/menaquinone biosynthesis C-methylase UbiE